jgi:hypothetical protein
VQLQVLYCDDIREELGNKYSLMGVYASDLLVPELPAVISRLCVAVRLAIPIKSKLSNDITLEVIKEQKRKKAAETLVTSQITAAQLKQAYAQAPAGSDYLLQANFMIGPLTFDQECRVRVRALVGKQVLEGASLQIRQLAV